MMEENEVENLDKSEHSKSVQFKNLLIYLEVSQTRQGSPYCADIAKKSQEV